MERKVQSVSLSGARASSWVEPGISDSFLPSRNSETSNNTTSMSTTPRVSMPPKTILFRNDPVDINPLALFNVRVHESEITDEPKFVDGLLLLPTSTVSFVKDLLRPLESSASSPSSSASKPNIGTVQRELDECFTQHIARLEGAMTKRIEDFIQQERKSFEKVKKDAIRAQQELISALEPLISSNLDSSLSTVPNTPESMISTTPSSQKTIVGERHSVYGENLIPPKLILPTSASLLGGLRRGIHNSDNKTTNRLDMGDGALFQFEEVENSQEFDQDEGNENGMDAEDEDGPSGRTEEDNLGNNDRGEIVLATSVPISIPQISSTPSAASLRRETMSRDLKERIQKQNSTEGTTTSMAVSIQSLSKVDMADQDSFQPNSPGD